jgi:hypothetical protein
LFCTQFSYKWTHTIPNAAWRWKNLRVFEVEMQKILGGGRMLSRSGLLRLPDPPWSRRVLIARPAAMQDAKGPAFAQAI